MYIYTWDYEKLKVILKLNAKLLTAIVCMQTFLQGSQDSRQLFFLWISYYCVKGLTVTWNAPTHLASCQGRTEQKVVRGAGHVVGGGDENETTFLVESLTKKSTASWGRSKPPPPTLWTTALTSARSQARRSELSNYPPPSRDSSIHPYKP